MKLSKRRGNRGTFFERRGTAGHYQTGRALKLMPRERNLEGKRSFSLASEKDNYRCKRQSVVDLIRGPSLRRKGETKGIWKEGSLPFVGANRLRRSLKSVVFFRNRCWPKKKAF